ncbi:thioredoxin family protein [Apibacter sp. HY039]|uniref:thioredoxin family protein n=1 Tax=Apibacter sp. HY039 TaxID=2501476 RepID=UPI000FEBC63D|nr:thioredoxin family protein [Apibacter sp. HY039]
MKKIWIIFLFIISQLVHSQVKKLYSPLENAEQKIDSLLSVAQKENKFVLIQIGGNWCQWCLRFHQLIKETPEIQNIINKNFLVYNLNYSKENKNEELLTKYEFPQRFGFPVFVILNQNGVKIHTQQSDYLENGENGYNIERVKNFLEQWSPIMLDSKTYQK